jgi:hypothetical protein
LEETSTFPGNYHIIPKSIFLKPRWNGQLGTRKGVLASVEQISYGIYKIHFTKIITERKNDCGLVTQIAENYLTLDHMYFLKARTDTKEESTSDGCNNLTRQLILHYRRRYRLNGCSKFCGVYLPLITSYPT